MYAKEWAHAHTVAASPCLPCGNRYDGNTQFFRLWARYCPAIARTPDLNVPGTMETVAMFWACASLAMVSGMRWREKTCEYSMRPHCRLVPPTAMLHTIAQTDWITGVTAVHHLVGGLAPYMLDPRTAGFALKKGKDMKGAEQALLDIALTMGTGHAMPMLVDDYTPLLLQDEHINTTTKIFRTFQEDLGRLSDQVNERNRRRVAAGSFAFRRFDPRRLRVSVSV